MRRAEKKDYLLEYCRECISCSECILNDPKHKWLTPIDGNNCPDFLESPDEDLDKAIKLILDTTEDIEEIRKINDLYKRIKLIQESEDLHKAHNTDKLVEAVNHPDHYNDGKIEVIDFIEDKNLGFCLGNAVKYISRAGKKDKSKEAEDIKKAIWYLNRYLGQEAE